jgi:hypothetical protein
MKKNGSQVSAAFKSAIFRTLTVEEVSPVTRRQDGEETQVINSTKIKEALSKNVNSARKFQSKLRNEDKSIVL